MLKYLEILGPILCIKNIYPDQYGSIDTSKYRFDYDRAPMINAINNVIIDAYEKNNPAVDLIEADTVMDDVISRMGDDVDYLAPHDMQNSEDYRRTCNAVIKYYEIIIALDKPAAGNFLRYIFSD